MMRKEYELNKEQLDGLMEASKPVPYMVFGGHEPSSPRENANRAWARLGNEMGFKYMTVQPVKGKSVSFFTAEESEKVLSCP
jgi:predicted TIM-barrel fold metal-dependent hydrolase